MKDIIQLKSLRLPTAPAIRRRTQKKKPTKVQPLARQVSPLRVDPPKIIEPIIEPAEQVVELVVEPEELVAPASPSEELLVSLGFPGELPPEVPNDFPDELLIPPDREEPAEEQTPLELPFEDSQESAKARRRRRIAALKAENTPVEVDNSNPL